MVFFAVFTLIASIIPNGVPCNDLKYSLRDDNLVKAMKENFLI